MPEFDDPFKSPESTVLRPRPGAGRPGSNEQPARQSPGSAPAAPAAPVSAAAIETLGIGLNPLVRAASGLLILTGQLRGTLAGPDIPTLRRHALDEIRRFEDRARAAGVQNEVVLAARYALCAGLDEAVLSTPWGAQSEWGQQTLLVALHREAWGGEKFFEMLERISSDPKRHIDLMELQYLCLAFGFAGKYQVADRGHARLSDIQHDLYRRIRDYRGAPPTELSLRWKGIEDRRNPLIRYVPWWVVGAAALAVLAITFVVFRGLLGSAASPIHVALSEVGMEGWAAGGPAPSSKGRTLKEILTGESRVTVTEDAGKSIVTLNADDLFDSRSATVKSEYLPVLNRVAAALKEVGGQVLVMGHTDNRRLRSLRSPRDNQELSVLRARSVADVLAGTIGRSQLDANGMGDQKPLPSVQPSDPRNRRVEIWHRRLPES